MGFLSSLGDFAANAVAPTLNVAAERQRAQAARSQQQQQQLLQMYLMQRQAEGDRRADALQRAQVGHLNAETDALKNPMVSTTVKPDASGRYVLIPTKIRQDATPVPAVPTGVKVPVKPVPHDPVAVHQANRDYDIQHPLPRSPSGEPGVFVGDPNDPTAPPVYTPRSKAFGGIQARKPQAENAMNVAAQARLKAAVSEMNNSDSNMAEYEQKLATGTARINAGQQLLARMANAFTHDDPLSQLTQSGTLAALNQTDPELARYIRRGLSFAEGESMISQRPSDFRTKMSAFLSTAASGATPELIHDIQGRRKAILDPLNETVNDKPAPANVAPSGARGAPKKDPGGNIDLRDAPPSAPSPAAAGGLTPAQVDRAKRDPEYAAFLKATGKMP